MTIEELEKKMAELEELHVETENLWNGDKWLFTGPSRAQAERAYAEARKDNIPKG